MNQVTASHPSFFQQHQITILASSMLITLVTGAVMGFFAAQGGAAFLAPGIPLSLMSLASSGCLIKALITPQFTPPSPVITPPPPVLSPPPKEILKDVDYAPLFAQGKELYTCILTLYGKTYGINMRSEIDTVCTHMDTWQAGVEDAFKNDFGFFIWMGVDSPFVLKDDAKRLATFRTGKLSMQEVKQHLQEQLPDSKMLITSWWKDFSDDQPFNPTNPASRIALAKAYNNLPEKSRITLSNKLAALNYTRTEFEIMQTWRRDIKEPILENAPFQTKAARQANDYILGEWMLSTSIIPLIRGTLQKQIQAKVEGAPGERFNSTIFLIAEQLLIPIACALYRGAKFYKVLQPIIAKIADHDLSLLIASLKLHLPQGETNT